MNNSQTEEQLRARFLAWVKEFQCDLYDLYEDDVANDEDSFENPGHFREYYSAFVAGYSTTL